VGARRAYGGFTRGDGFLASLCVPSGGGSFFWLCLVADLFLVVSVGWSVVSITRHFLLSSFASVSSCRVPLWAWLSPFAITVCIWHASNGCRIGACIVHAFCALFIIPDAPADSVSISDAPPRCVCVADALARIQASAKSRESVGSVSGIKCT
jgi:hypothetical protein